MTGASGRNWDSYGSHMALDAQVPDAMRSLLTDPQTSGGLLVSCTPAAARQVLDIFKSQGFADACVVGHMQAGEAQVVVS